MSDTEDDLDNNDLDEENEKVLAICFPADTDFEVAISIAPLEGLLVRWPRQSCRSQSQLVAKLLRSEPLRQLDHQIRRIAETEQLGRSQIRRQDGEGIIDEQCRSRESLQEFVHLTSPCGAAVYR